MDNSGTSRDAIGSGGPMDGTILGDEAATEYEIVTADRARWRYVRTDDLTTNEMTGAVARLYRCAGRI